MTSIQEIARQAALDANKRVDGTTLKQVADAVASAVGEVWARYRPQHAEECSLGRCQRVNPDDGTYLHHLCGFRVDDPIHETQFDYAHEFIGKPCSCGLSDLLASVERSGESQVEEKKEDHGAGLTGQTIPDVDGTQPRLNRDQRS